MEWTRTQFNERQREFLRNLPISAEHGDQLYVHASANEPAAWHYVVGPEAASRSFMATRKQVTFCGHVHVPALYHLSVTGKLASFTPEGDAIPLNRFGSADEIAQAIVFLCSPQASYLTGQVIAVDGGFDAAGVGLPALRS